MNITMYKLPQTHCRFPWEQFRNITVFFLMKFCGLDVCAPVYLGPEVFSCHCNVFPPLLSDQSESLMCFCETVITITLGCRSWG